VVLRADPGTSQPPYKARVIFSIPTEGPPANLFLHLRHEDFGGPDLLGDHHGCTK
jgi:hypothetical protein